MRGVTEEVKGLVVPGEGVRVQSSRDKPTALQRLRLE